CHTAVMQIDGYVQALGEDLARVAAVGDESTARAAELLAVALESALGRRLLEALGEAALELSSQLDDGRVEVRFAGGDPLRVPVEAAAANAGVTPADWLASVIRRSLRPTTVRAIRDGRAPLPHARAGRDRDQGAGRRRRRRDDRRRGLADHGRGHREDARA